MAERPANEADGRPARPLPRAPRRGQHRRSVAVGPALPRDDRPRREDADRLRVDPHGREVGHLGADPRADRIGQGSRRADDPRAEPPQRGEVPGGQLRRAARHAVRVGNLRLRERRLHRRARSQAGPPRAGQRRHAVPRRDRRHVAHRAGQAAARARGAALRAPRRQQVDLGRLPPDLGDQPAARAVRARRPLPRRSLLPRQRVRDPAAVAARAAGRHPGARAALPRALLRGAGAAARQQELLARSARPARAATSGPATSASSKARSRAPRCRRRAASIRASDIEFLHADDGRRRRRRAIACRRSPKPSARTSSACSRRCDWNKKEAARVLDISRGTLYRKIVEYQLEPEARPGGPRREP